MSRVSMGQVGRAIGGRWVPWARRLDEEGEGAECGARARRRAGMGVAALMGLIGWPPSRMGGFVAGDLPRAFGLQCSEKAV